MNNQVNLGEWSQRLSNPKNIELALAYKITEMSDPYVPFRSGAMAGHTKIIGDDVGAHIVYSEKYSHKQFVGVSPSGKPFNYTITHHPDAGSHWINRVKDESIDEIKEFTEEALIHGIKKP
ncbi:minor capsid protein [Companilactobacillus allii]|uniref:Minor capsid protein n=1 Tax=Companilactobacillus allii TaxID=1847728 RepID=A0A1P8Q4V6_9LACO|nr:minor capsid protein [Companilactobacillus allii]APX72865.1 hypothetical protein BTM29_10020 [Companilactobacillus allii]USQ67653.1 minor capsid protein [Companilactobacillus allii]